MHLSAEETRELARKVNGLVATDTSYYNLGTPEQICCTYTEIQILIQSIDFDIVHYGNVRIR